MENFYFKDVSHVISRTALESTEGSGGGYPHTRTPPHGPTQALKEGLCLQTRRYNTIFCARLHRTYRAYTSSAKDLARGSHPEHRGQEACTRSCCFLFTSLARIAGSYKSVLIHPFCV